VDGHDELAARFREAPEFTSSPLYRELGRAVADDPRALRIAARARRGQYPTFLLFAAVHELLLRGAPDELREWYPSVVGERARDPEGVGPAFAAFCAAHEVELVELVATRLVQTNNVKRSLALRLGLATLAGERSAVHLVEIGASAGVHLRADRYGYALGGRRGGVVDSPVQIAAAWRGGAAPDLDGGPSLASVTGIDLHPLDAADAEDRAWLEALVWPENRHEAELLHAALDLVAEDPPRLLAGDAVAVCPRLDEELPAGEPRVVFESATRMHVPAEDGAAFDAAIASLGRRGPLYVLALGALRPDRRRPGHGATLTLRRPDGSVTPLYAVDGHLEWVAPPP
jgi:hypothetical protein